MEEKEKTIGKNIANCENVLVTLRSELLVLGANLSALKERVNENEQRLSTGHEDLDGHVDNLRERVRVLHDEVKDLIRQQGEELSTINQQQFDQCRTLIQQHANDDAAALQEIRDQLLNRVPPWALSLMTAGGSLIGAMISYIFSHGTK